VRRNQEIEAGRRAVSAVVGQLRTHVVTIVTACRYGERGLVTKELIGDLRASVDLLEAEIQ